MRKIREVLRLKFEVGLSARQVAVSLQVGRASVGEYLNRFAATINLGQLRALFGQTRYLITLYNKGKEIQFKSNRKTDKNSIRIQKKVIAVL